MYPIVVVVLTPLKWSCLIQLLACPSSALLISATASSSQWMLWLFHIWKACCKPMQMHKANIEEKNFKLRLRLATGSVRTVSRTFTLLWQDDRCEENSCHWCWSQSSEYRHWPVSPVFLGSHNTSYMDGNGQTLFELCTRNGFSQIPSFPQEQLKSWWKILAHDTGIIQIFLF